MKPPVLPFLLAPILVGLALFATPQAASAQQVIQVRGVDSRVDYASLKRFGPWDDRNYQLTADDVALLPEDDTSAKVAVPAFFRILIRKDIAAANLPFQLYPRSSYPRFMSRYGGYLVNRQLFKNYQRTPDGYQVQLDEESTTPLEFLASRVADSEVRITSPEGAAESAIAINPVDTDLVIAGTNGPGAGQVMHYSDDGGATWSSAGGLAGSCCDPTMGWSTDGTKGYTATLGTSVDFYTTTDDGLTWGNKRVIDVSGSVDKEYLHVDSSPTSAHKDNIYLTWHLGNQMRFAKSTDFGNTWSAVTNFAAAPSGIGSDIATDKDGDIYYIYPAFGPQEIVLLKSDDGGSTFDPSLTMADTEGSFIFPVPSMETREVFIYVSADADLSGGPFANSIYAAWTDSTATTSGTPANNHARIQVGYSRDGGATWTMTTPHPTGDAATVDRYHQWLKVGPDGTVHVVYYDTSFDADRTSVDFAYSFSTDGAVTWSVPERLTSVTSANITSGFEWGDYNGLDVVLDNLISIHTDNRHEGVPSGNSVDVYALLKTVGSSEEIFSDGFESGNTGAWAP